MRRCLRLIDPTVRRLKTAPKEQPPLTQRLTPLTASEKVALMREIDLERHRRQIDALAQFERLLSAGQDRQKLLALVPKIVFNTLDAEAASLQLYNLRHNSLVFYAVEDPLAPHLAGQSIPATQGIGARALRTGRSTITRNVRQAPDYNATVEKVTGRPIESLLTVPIKSPQGEPLGIVQVLMGADEFWEYDLQFLQVLSALAAYPVQQGYDLLQ